MKTVLLCVLVLSLPLGAAEGFAAYRKSQQPQPACCGTCSGGANCRACKTCGYCYNCNHGGACSVCRPDLFK